MRQNRWSILLTALSALAALGLTGCGDAGLGGSGLDGGVGGTGISLISGNVAPEADEAHAELQGIVVTVVGTEVHSETDEIGFFELEGAFDGDVTLEFREPDGTLNVLPLDVPSGGVVSLRDVRLAGGRASADRIDVDFEGIVGADAQCIESPQTVEVSDRALSNHFLVRLDDASYEFDARRCPDIAQQQRDAECADLQSQRTVRIVGVAGGDRLIAARSVRLVNCRTPGTGR